VLPGGEPCLSYRRITGNWSSWSGINHVPDVGFFSGVRLRSEAMVVLNKLRKVGNYVRKGWNSTNPDSYSHYKRGRMRERKQAERSREEADRSAQLDREEVQRGREYEERYAAERAAEDPQTESPPDHMGKSE
jgi:hypothetical protein